VIPASVTVGAHTLRLRTPSVVERLAYRRGYFEARATGEAGEIAGCFAALDVAWDRSSGPPPWGDLTGSVLERGLAVAEHVGTWDCGAVAIHVEADNVAVEMLTSVRPPDPKKVEAAKENFLQTEAGSSKGTASQPDGAAPPSPGTT
jgi:hypothetical protein